MKEITVKVYGITELNDKAKEKARAWYREDAFNFPWYESIYEDAGAVAARMGITIAAADRGKGLKIYFSGFSSQGDGACFEGAWAACDVKPGQVKEYAPQDVELHRIADIFEKVAKRYPNARFSVRHSGHYYHNRCTSFDVEIVDENDNHIETEIANQTHDELVEATRDFMLWIYRSLEKEYEWLNSDQQIDEAIQANDYTFREDGTFFRA